MNGEMLMRNVYESECEGRLLKLKKGMTSTYVELHYNFYGRRFHKVVEKRQEKEK